MNSDFLQNLIVIITGAFVATFFAFDQYRRQKIYENINKRYIENGLEDLISYLDGLRVIIEHNWSNSLKLINNFKNYDYERFLASIRDKKFENIISSKIPTSFFRCYHLFDDVFFQQTCTDIFVDAYIANEFFVSDLPNILSKDFIGKSTALDSIEKRAEFIEKMKEEIDRKYSEIRKDLIYEIMELLEDILFRIRELDVNSYEELKGIKTDKNIINLLHDFSKKHAQQTIDEK
jgi:hypothetical protein